MVPALRREPYKIKAALHFITTRRSVISTNNT